MFFYCVYFVQVQKGEAEMTTLEMDLLDCSAFYSILR